MTLTYDEEKVAYLHDFFERRIEFLQEMLTWLERVDASQAQLPPSKIEPGIFFESFRFLAGALISEFRLIYHIFEHLGVGLHFSNTKNSFLLGLLASTTNRSQCASGAYVSNTEEDAGLASDFEEKATAFLAELWKIAETKQKEQEEEL